MRTLSIIGSMALAGVASAQEGQTPAQEIECPIFERCQVGKACEAVEDELKLVQFPEGGLTVLNLPDNQFGNGFATSIPGRAGQSVIVSGTTQNGEIVRIIVFGTGKVTALIANEGVKQDRIYYGNCLEAVS